MTFIKFYLFPILLGTVAGFITLWAFDSFVSQDSRYYAKLVLQSLIPVAIVVIVINLKRKKSNKNVLM